MNKNNWRVIFLLLALCHTQSALATPTTPTSDFIDNGDGTVTHKLTGLVWQRCSVGQTWTGSTCAGTATTYTWDAAIALKSNFAGKNDWRLPNIVELNTIIERENYQPAINNTIFPNTSSDWSWSSSPDAINSNNAWVVFVSNGGNGSTFKDSGFSIRLVRAGQWTFDSLPLTTPTSDFIDNKDGTVTHQRTGLIWQRCSVGQTWTGATCSGSAATYTWDTAMALKSNVAGLNDWRLPTIGELLSTVEYGNYYPAINQTLFPETSSSWFWSSSLGAYNDSSSAWVVNYRYGIGYGGYNGYYGSGYGGFVRLVRGSQSTQTPPKLDLTQTNCRYVASIYNSIWQQMKTKNAPSCGAALRYYTWTKFTRPENYIASNYYSNRLNGIDATHQILDTSLQGVDTSLSVLSVVLDPDLKKILSPTDYQATSNILNSKGVLQSLKDGQTPFKTNTLKGRFLHNALKGIVLGEGIKKSSEFLCQQLLNFDGAVAQSCMNESSKIANCTFSLADGGWQGAGGCVMGAITSVTGFINTIYDIGQVVAIKQHNYGYILINDYLNNYYAKGSASTALDEAKLEADIQKYADKLHLSSSSFNPLADFEMQFVKEGIRDSILRNLVTANRHVRLAEQLRNLLNK